MKKVLLLLVGLMITVSLIGCGGPLVNEAKDYYVAGNSLAWDTLPENQMEAIAKNDERVASIKDDLDGVQYLYIFEHTFPAEAAGWGNNIIIDGENVFFDGNLTVKVIRNAAGDMTQRDWWAPSPESGEVSNLTPDTLWLPPFVENATETSVDDNGTPDDTTDDITYTSGAWNDNGIPLEPGTYYVVFAEFEDGTKAMGLIPVTTAE